MFSLLSPAPLLACGIAELEGGLSPSSVLVES